MRKYIYPEYSKNLLSKIANIETPCIIYDIKFIEKTIDHILEDLALYKNSSLYFAMKANNNEKILNLFKSKGLGIDVASVNEYKLAKKLGFKKLSITNPSFSEENIQEFGSDIVSIDSLSQLKKVKSKEIGLRISIRQSVYEEFGVDYQDNRLFNYIKENGIIVKKIHFHSSNFNIERLKQQIDIAEHMIKLFPSIDIIDMGGDLLTLYKERKKFLQILIELNKNKYFFKKEVIFEPGDMLLKYGGFLITSVINEKRSGGKDFIFLDSSLWCIGPWYRGTPISLNKNKIKKEYIVKGNTLYSGDIFGKYMLPIIKEGDKLVFPEFGAYTMSNFRRFHLLDYYNEYIYNEDELVKI